MHILRLSFGLESHYCRWFQVAMATERPRVPADRTCVAYIIRTRCVTDRRSEVESDQPRSLADWLERDGGRQTTPSAQISVWRRKTGGWLWLDVKGEPNYNQQSIWLLSHGKFQQRETYPLIQAIKLDKKRIGFNENIQRDGWCPVTLRNTRFFSKISWNLAIRCSIVTEITSNYCQ